MDFVKQWNNMLNSHIGVIGKYFPRVKPVAQEYEESKNEISDIGFNIFKLSSDLYYRENFHSDIIKAFLDPYESHGQENKYLNIFVEMLGLEKSDFEYSTVRREPNNIDILITNQNSKKAIIIENKVNNAVDMYRQLPRYYEIVKQDYEVAAIVYITLDKSKRPDISTWTTEEIEDIKALLKIIPVFSRDGTTNLVDHWINPAIIKSNDLDSSLILRQYAKLIKYLNTSTMDTISLEKFYNSLKEEDNLKTAISIRNMLNDLPTYMAIRIEEKYKYSCQPFLNVWRYKEIDTVFDKFILEDNFFKMGIWCYVDGYEVYLSAPNDEKLDVASYFKRIDRLNDFVPYKGDISCITRRFDVLDEESLFDFISSILIEFSDLKKEKV